MLDIFAYASKCEDGTEAHCYSMALYHLMRALSPGTDAVDALSKAAAFFRDACRIAHRDDLVVVFRAVA